MKVNDFIRMLKHIESLKTIYYSKAGGSWAKWNGTSWNFDCVILIKAILWGWCENKNHPHGGAIYNSNGVKDVNADGLIKLCKNVSTDFTSIKVGEILHMKGHVGVYIGNGEVIECTAAWEGKVVKSSISSNGKRTRNGSSAGYWQEHGFHPNIDYKEESKEETKKDKSTTELANEVIAGYKWGNGEERKKRLTEAGYNYREVQDEVNRILHNQNSEVYHIVKKGECLWDIALKYYGDGTKYKKIKELNNLTSDTIYPNQKLRVK